MLVLDGQLFEGGWQHRMATRSVLLPGRPGWLSTSPASSSTAGVAGAPSTPGAAARRRTCGTGSTGLTVSRRSGAGSGGTTEPARPGRSSTGSAAEEQAQIVRRHIRPLPGQTGVVVGIGGQPLALEVFDHPKTLAEQYEAIVRAACLDAFGQAALPTPGRRARRLVERLETSALDVMSLQHRLRTIHLRATYRRHPLLQEAA